VSGTAERTKTERLLHSPELCAMGVEDSFWIGDGDTLAGRLFDEGWSVDAWEAPYYWVLARDGRYISYTEGDVSFSRNMMCGAKDRKE